MVDGIVIVMGRGWGCMCVIAMAGSIGPPDEGGLIGVDRVCAVRGCVTRGSVVIGCVVRVCVLRVMIGCVRGDVERICW